LFHQIAGLQGRYETERRRLVDADLAGDVSYAYLAVAGQDLEDCHRAVDGLDR
jgi:hypothetical protein